MECTEGALDLWPPGKGQSKVWKCILLLTEIQKTQFFPKLTAENFRCPPSHTYFELYGQRRRRSSCLPGLLIKNLEHASFFLISKLSYHCRLELKDFVLITSFETYIFFLKKLTSVYSISSSFLVKWTKAENSRKRLKTLPVCNNVNQNSSTWLFYAVKVCFFFKSERKKNNSASPDVGTETENKFRSYLETWLKIIGAIKN